MYNTIIIGGGAAGLAAAAALAHSCSSVLLLERGARIGRKLMATGNGRCNLSNVQMEPDFYYEASPFVTRMYEAMPPQEVLSFFKELGLLTAVEQGRIYPRSFSASSVLDLLRQAIDTPAVEQRLNAQVRQISWNSKRGCWNVRTDQDHFSSEHLLIAAGGNAAPQFGTDGSGAALLSSLGLSVESACPALVQLKCRHPVLKSLKGLRTYAELTLQIPGESDRTETGELLFAEYGVSGICVFQLSRWVSQALPSKEPHLLIHFLPEMKKADVRTWLHERLTQYEGRTVLSLFTGVFQRMLAQAILKEASLSPDSLLPISSTQEEALLSALTAFELPVVGTAGFDHAQVTRGGLSLPQVDPETMQISGYPGLYAAGEVLDCDGPCGGYNLHFAFCSGLLAARSILQEKGTEL